MDWAVGRIILTENAMHIFDFLGKMYGREKFKIPHSAEVHTSSVHYFC